jgi:dTDP-4-dehydrorhamnose reductase
MKIIILGGNGMIGHKMYQLISNKYNDTWITLRNDFTSYSNNSFFDRLKVIDNLDLTHFDKVEFELYRLMPDIIINAAGITIRRGVDKVISDTIKINSVLPHFLNEWVINNNKRLIHFSTDCVFSGLKGDYLDGDYKDADDIYGRTKAIGEVVNSTNTITLRSSMIGRELENKTELLEWFLKHCSASVTGFSAVIYSGISTIEMAKIVLKIIQLPCLTGVYNVSSLPLSKFELLSLINQKFLLNAQIISDDSYKSNKNLISKNLISILNIPIPNWANMILELKVDSDLNKRFYI